MTDGSRTDDQPARQGRNWLTAGWLAMGRGLTMFFLGLAAVLLAWFAIVGTSLTLLGFGLFLVPGLVTALRWSANTQRRLTGNTGVRIAEPYGPAPRAEGGWKGAWRKCVAVFTDSATWRDMLWAQCAVTVTGLLAILPFASLVHGLFGMLLPFIWEPVVQSWDGTWYLFVPVRGQESAWIAGGLGLLEIPVGLLVAPYVLRLHARITRSLLAPTAKARMGRRVEHLARTRTDVVDSSAAEIRRIERDLHDGAQARLLAMGMKLSAAESLLDENPEAVRTLLAETRDASMRALEELRDLVRGIHPPVLADRGLVDAVRSLALESRLQVQVTAGVPDRPEPAVESAAYFAVCELLANATKHSGARRVLIDIQYRANALAVSVTDDGHGGAGPESGSGLQGVQRRLAAFDGTLGISSPVGGPTTVSLQIPCALTVTP
ncbi:sensor histidine kinase [Streptomyces albofaciens JCM 4342]|uniref:sensor histidine kinase n=1 Tax=Streptomyces albofaciens TaxID=66866 RepID=UPI0012390669|nr:sensor histidine kinase [Streptomyces albofaciens]KAA6224110.1 sensor histidine kinase [Streptomyces albofaciens JCM 4342]